MGPAGHGVGYLYEDIKDVQKTNLVEANGKPSNGVGIANGKTHKDD